MVATLALAHRAALAAGLLATATLAPAMPAPAAESDWYRGSIAPAIAYAHLQGETPADGHVRATTSWSTSGAFHVTARIGRITDPARDAEGFIRQQLFQVDLARTSPDRTSTAVVRLVEGWSPTGPTVTAMFGCSISTPTLATTYYTDAVFASTDHTIGTAQFWLPRGPLTLCGFTAGGQVRITVRSAIRVSGPVGGGQFTATVAPYSARF